MTGSPAGSADGTSRYKTRLANDAAALRRLAVAIERAPNSAELRREIEMLTHRLAGSAGLFGFREIAAIAGAIETLVEAGTPAPLVAYSCSTLANEIEAANHKA